jgi:primosomal protein N' (replication factor Y)
MVAKGHDFPGMTLVGVVNMDQGLFSHDFRATEHMLQQVMQVTGRAGRAELGGDVLLQTAYPNHACFELLRQHDYDGFVAAALPERRQAGFPPFTHLALLRAQSHLKNRAMAFLSQVQSSGRQLLRTTPRSGLRLMDPVPSPMEKRAGRYRAQLLIASDTRPALHGFLRTWLRQFEEHPEARRVQWSLDVDPIDLY